MIWFLSQRSKYYIDVLGGTRPDARADIRGSAAYPGLNGRASFYQTKDGVLLSVEVMGLPGGDGPCAGGVFGFHIHEGEACTGTAEDPFADAKGHYNPNDCKHPITPATCRRSSGRTDAPSRSFSRTGSRSATSSAGR